jgi:molybdate transport system ATP-binding protein
VTLDADLHVERETFTLRAAFAVPPGETLAVVGPNGAGKSTMLRLLAGLLPLTAGRITVGDQVWDDGTRFVPAVDRAVGLVFQDYRLFPHLSVLDNVAFAARSRGARRPAARAGAREVLGRLGLDQLAARRPAQLSGGQAQRVALARALASRPRLLLLDEPLAALDARTRIEVRAELRDRLRDFGGPSVVVTHDPLEALVLADRILVLEDGRVVQHGPPGEVARRPATEYVARLMGLNLYAGSLADPGAGRIELDDGGNLFTTGTTEHRTGQALLVSLAPSAIELHVRRPEGSARNVWAGTVSGIELLTDRVRVAVAGSPAALVDVTPAAVADLELRAGTPVWLSAKATETSAYSSESRITR